LVYIGLHLGRQKKILLVALNVYLERLILPFVFISKNIKKLTLCLPLKKFNTLLALINRLRLEHGLTLSRACVFDYLVKGIAWATDIMEVDGKTFFYLSRVKANE
jgi:hypothetical protein